MKSEAVYHRTSDNYCYALDNDLLIINLKTGYDVSRVFLVYGDPFSHGILGGNEGWDGQEIEIYYKKRLRETIWWTTTIKPAFKRCRYYFKLQAADGTFYYYENGVFPESQATQGGVMLQYFTFPWLNSADVNRAPQWVNDTVWYEIFPDRFRNGDPTNDPKGSPPWQTRAMQSFETFGGDLAGILEKLDYLQDLGVTGLYLTPVCQAGSNHKYDTTDYLQIDPAFGDEALFRKLVDEAHRRGMRVMMDGVFNHCGPKFAPWLDVVEKGPQSRYYDWFMVNRWPFPHGGNTSDGRYYSFAFSTHMPKLNTNNPDVQDYILHVIRHWMETFDVDGLRLDVANELSHRMCKRIRETCKELRPDFYILGEIWHDSIHWLRGDELDAVMNYPLMLGINEFWHMPGQTSADFEYAINHYYTMYMQQTNDVLFNMLDSHDTDRLINRTGNLDIFYQQLAVLFTMPGSPCIFYGTELALEGGFDPDCRRCMPWDAIERGDFNDRIERTRRLIALRKSEPTFKSRNFHFPNDYGGTRVIQYIKLQDNARTEVLLNCTGEAVRIPGNGAVLFAHRFRDGLLEPNGTLIRAYQEYGR